MSQFPSILIQAGRDAVVRMTRLAQDIKDTSLDREGELVAAAVNEGMTPAQARAFTNLMLGLTSA